LAALLSSWLDYWASLGDSCIIKIAKSEIGLVCSQIQIYFVTIPMITGGDEGTILVMLIEPSLSFLILYFVNKLKKMKKITNIT